MDRKREHESQVPEETTSFVIRAGTTLVGAAAGARIIDTLVGGRGFVSALAQLGGAILGGLGGSIVGETLLEEAKGDKR